MRRTVVGAVLVLVLGYGVECFAQTIRSRFSAPAGNMAGAQQPQNFWWYNCYNYQPVGNNSLRPDQLGNNNLRPDQLGNNNLRPDQLGNNDLRPDQIGASGSGVFARPSQPWFPSGGSQPLGDTPYLWGQSSRDWHFASGETANALLIGLRGQKAILMRSDNQQVIGIPLKNLSKADREFIGSLKQPR